MVESECCKHCLAYEVVFRTRPKRRAERIAFCSDKNCPCHRLARIEALLKERK
jgi:hypothetical protein